MNYFVDFYNTYYKVMVTFANLGLVIVISLSLAQGVLFFIEQKGQASLGIPQTPVLQTSEIDKKNIDIELIIDIFGQLQTVPIQQLLDAPKTTLKLELQGIFIADKSSESSAIVAEQGEQGQLYLLGDRLPGNATLKAVLADHVLIEHGARTEKLAFPEHALAGQIDPAVGVATVRRSNNGIGRLTNRLQVSDALATPEKVKANSVQQMQQRVQHPQANGAPSAYRLEQIAAYRDKFVTEPEAILDEFDLSLIEKDGTTGYQFNGEAPPALLNQVGLRQGDVILTVNGRPVGEVVNNQSFIGQTLAAQQVRVEVQRGTRRFFVTVPMPK